MSSKTILLLCAQALLAQTAFSQCIGGGLAGPYGFGGFAGYNGMGGMGLNGFGSGLAGYGAGCGCGASGVASTGGGLPVASSSPIAPVGVSVLSENVYEGSLTAGGNLPFLGSVGVEGVLPTAGAGAVSYGCGDGGAVAIGSEGPEVTGIAIPGALFPPTSPNSVATNDALALVPGLGNYNPTGYGFGGAGYGFGAGNAGYGLGGVPGYGLGGVSGYGLGAGCGCGRF